MENIAEIRRRHKINGESISALAEEFKHSRTTIRKHLQSVEEPVYQRQHQPLPKLGEFAAQLQKWLERDQGNRAMSVFFRRSALHDNGHSNKRGVFAGAGCLCLGHGYSADSKRRV